MVRLALFQPEIPQNAGALIRLSACFGFFIDIIGPCGFLLDDKRLKRSAMDYANLAKVNYYDSFQNFIDNLEEGARLISLISRSGVSFHQFKYKHKDVLLAGTESSGLPAYVMAICSESVSIPMIKGIRSINLALASAIVISESIRQLNLFPDV